MCTEVPIFLGAWTSIDIKCRDMLENWKPECLLGKHDPVAAMNLLFTHTF